MIRISVTTLFIIVFMHVVHTSAEVNADKFDIRSIKIGMTVDEVKKHLPLSKFWEVKYFKMPTGDSGEPTKIFNVYGNRYFPKENGRETSMFFKFTPSLDMPDHTGLYWVQLRDKGSLPDERGVSVLHNEFRSSLITKYGLPSTVKESSRVRQATEYIYCWGENCEIYNSYVSRNPNSLFEHGAEGITTDFSDSSILVAAVTAYGEKGNSWSLELNLIYPEPMIQIMRLQEDWKKQNPPAPIKMKF